MPAPYNLLLPLPAPTGKPQDHPHGGAGAEVLQLIGTPWHVTKAGNAIQDEIGQHPPTLLSSRFVHLSKYQKTDAHAGAAWNRGVNLSGQKS